MKITIAGDFYISPSYVNQQLFSSEIIDFFNRSDINILNLECPITNGVSGKKIIKTGPHLYTTYKIIDSLKSINIGYLTLANNHIRDFGSESLINTLDLCEENNIKTTGAGKTLEEASKPLIIEKDGVKLSFINFCENEWSIATDKDAGANPLDVIDNLKQIKIARDQADFVIVIIHGGHEYYNLPSPRMVKQYRFFAENGADVVVGHHTHCFSGYEIHNHVPIFYGLGNMLFTKPSKYEDWYKGLLLQIKINQDKMINWTVHPVNQSKTNFRLDLMKDEEKAQQLNVFNGLSGIIRNEENLLQNWKNFILEHNKTMTVLSPINSIPGRYIRGMLFRIFKNKLIQKKSLEQILNHIRCEAHRDLIVELLIKELKANENRDS